MPRKAPRPDHQVEQLAAEFRRRWVAADGVEPWLRRHVARLTRLVRDERWSWADIGRAMTAAGILYSTGKPWSGRLLLAKIGRARMQVRRRDQARAASVDRSAAPSGLVAQGTAQPGLKSASARPLDGTGLHSAVASAPELQDEEPEFQFVRYRSPSAPVPPLPSSAPSPAPTPASSVDVDAVLRRFRGEGVPSNKGSTDDDREGD